MSKYIGMLILLVVMTGTTLLAQRGHHRHMPELTDAQKAQLSLSTEQATALEDLQSATKADLDALHERTDLDHEARRAAAKAIFERAKTERDEILTGEQQAQLKAIRQTQREEHRARMAKVDHKAMRAELREYRKTEIEPVVRAQRAKLDLELSTEDQQRLVEIRTTLKEARQAAHAERQERKAQGGEQAGRKDRKHGRHHGKRGHHKQGHRMHRLMDKHPETFAELEAMVGRYDASITMLVEELEPQHEAWRAAQRTIKESYLPENHPHGDKKADRRPHDKREGEHVERKAMLKKIGFLLKNADVTEEETVATDKVERIATRTYPNPATNKTTLAFELPDPMLVTIDVRDENGNLVKTITQEQLEAGQHEIGVDLTDLRNGTYYLAITSDRLATPQSIKIVVVK